MEIIELLESKGIFLKKSGKSRVGPCPFCREGTDRFVVWPGEGKYWCRGCGKWGDDIQLLRDLEGMTFPEAKAALGRPLDSNPVPLNPKSSKSEIVATYDYADADGIFQHQVCRFKPKTFKQRRPGKRTEWIWDLKGVALHLFQLPEVVKSEYVFIVEGEKDCLSLKKIGLVATTNPMGAGKIAGQHEKFGILDPLQDKRVYIVPDNDKPGKDHAEQIAGILSFNNIPAEIKILNLDIKPSGDITDFIQERGADAKLDLKKLVDNARIWKPESPFIYAEDLLDMVFENHIPVISRGVLPKGERLLIAGEAGVGKSMLRLELAIHLVMGWDWLGFKIPKAQKVLMLQFENSEPIEQKRLELMLKGLEILELPTNRMVWIKRGNRMDLTKVGDQIKLRDMVKLSECDVVMYDCLSNFHSANENDNVKMRNVLDVTTDIDVFCNTSSVMIHHFGQPSENREDRYRIRGATSIVDWCGCGIAFTVKKHEHKFLRKLEFIKVRDAAPIKPLIVERNGHFTLEVVDLESKCNPQKIREILLNIGGEVDQQAKFIEAICDSVGCAERTARTAINTAIEMDQISVRMNGRNKGFYVY